MKISLTNLFKKFNFFRLRLRLNSFQSLKSRYPFFERGQATDWDMQRITEQYNFYTHHISRADMAASLELASLLLKICINSKSTKVADLGSGFTSYVFRYYASKSNNVQVWSVDDDKQWIVKTRDYLVKNNLSKDHVVMLDEFISENEAGFDLILLDLNFVEVRKHYITLAIDRCKPGGMVIFDDVHKPDFMYEVLQQTSNLPVTLYDLKPLTLDKYGRYACVAIKR